MRKLICSTLASFFISCVSFAAAGDSIWGIPVIHDIYLNYSQVSYWDSLVASHTNDTYIQTTMIFDGRTMVVGSKFKGNSSYNSPSNKKSLKIDVNLYDTTQDYDGIKKFNLNNCFKDPSYLREKIALDFMRDHGMNAPRCTYARVYINNAYYGVYTVVEEINSKFLKQHYPDNNGALFKGDPNGDLKWYGSSASSYYSHYELGSDDTTYDWNRLVHLIDIGNNTGTSVYYDSLETILDSWSFLNYMVMCNIFVNLDSYIGSGHNYYIYEDSTSGIFRMIPWDVNESFGNFQLSMSISQLESLNYDYLNQPTNRPIAQKMLANSTYHAMYISAFCAYMQDFNNAYLDPKIDSLANMIRTDVYNDTASVYTSQNFEDNIIMDIQLPGGPGGGWVPGIKSFISARNASLTSQLSAYGCWLGTQEQPVSNSINFYPNPANDQITMNLPQGWNSEECEVLMHDITGAVISIDLRASSGEQLTFDVSNLASGVYFASINDSKGNRTTARFVVRH